MRGKEMEIRTDADGLAKLVRDLKPEASFSNVWGDVQLTVRQEHGETWPCDLIVTLNKYQVSRLMSDIQESTLRLMYRPG